jgi:hypothetical protein
MGKEYTVLEKTSIGLLVFELEAIFNKPIDINGKLA